MKLIPAAISRKIAEQGLLASEHAPKVLFVGGVVGMVGSTVLACRATLQLSDVLDRIEHDKEARKAAKDDVENGRVPADITYPDNEYRKDIRVITVKGLGDVAKLYAPAVLLGGASIFALTKSHNLLRDRNLALTAAYAAVDGAYSRYRGRVIERYGEEVDRELRYETEEIDRVDEETGEIVQETVLIDAPGSSYFRWYDGESSANWSVDPDVNMMALNNVQNWANDKLKVRGHLFLNEVFSALGMSHTRAGAIVGWRYKKESGDDYVDLGIFEAIRGDDSNGREGAIGLDFNVDGPIHELIEEGS